MTSLSRYNLRYALRIIHHAGKRLLGTSRAEHSGTANDIEGVSAHHAGRDHRHRGGSHEKHSSLDPVADNDDVYKVRFKRRRGITKLKRLIVRIRRLLRVAMGYLEHITDPSLSLDERLMKARDPKNFDEDALEEHRRKKEEGKLFRLHREQARILETQIIDVLTNLGFCFSVLKDDRRYIKKRIKITRSDVTPYAYVYHIRGVPYGVKKTEMAQQWVADELASTVGKKIRYDLDLNGLRYTVEVGSTLSVPNFVTFKEFDAMPKNRPPLSFFAGETTNGAPVYRDLTDAPHMIVAGQTGGGKSNLLNGIICGLISRQPPSTVQLILFDLKGGVEFHPFYGVPHLWKHAEDQDGIIEYPENIIPALEAIKRECDRRLALLRKAKVKHVGEYNRGRHPKNRIPYIVGVFDEYTTARKLAGEKVEMLLSTIANISRAAGIHFIIGTQYPKSDVLSTLISVNFPWRVAFNMTPAASQSVLGSWDASGLTPVGRAILQTSEGQIYVQTPRITNSTINSIISAVKSGADEITVNTVDAEELIEWALNNTGGKLDRDTLFNQFKERITVAALNDLLRSMENKQYEVSDMYYIVRPPSGNQARRAEMTDGSERDDAVNEKPQTTVTSDAKVT